MANANERIGKIEVVYLDTDNNVLQEISYLNGDIGSEYKVDEVFTIVSQGNVYRLIGRQGKLAGLFKEEKQQVVFTYQLDPSLSPVDTVGAVAVNHEYNGRNKE